jgi:hypothetical protein
VKSAWTDAVYTLDVLVTIPVLAVMMAIWIIAIRLFPTTVGSFGMPKNMGLIVVLPLVIAVDALCSKYMSSYENLPNIRDDFATAGDAVGIWLSYGVCLLALVGMVAVLVVLRG